MSYVNVLDPTLEVDIDVMPHLVCRLKFEVIVSSHFILAFRGFDNVIDYQLDEKPEEIRHSQGKL